MAYFLGVDSSNYTTSVALYDSCLSKIYMEKQLLPVKKSELGLRQSDAVFAHVKQLHTLIERLFSRFSGQVKIDSVCVSTRPRSVEGSYMPAFLVGDMVASSIAAVLGVEKHECSHQDGHIVAALYSADALNLLSEDFYAFHLSGGTTECLSVKSAPPLFNISLLAQTLDLNAGQLVDRVGLMLGLKFPCGGEITRLALLCEEEIKLKPSFKGIDIHMSGVQNQCEKLKKNGAEDSYIARFVIEYIKATVDQMTEIVLKAYGDKPLVYAGGVMSNAIIREHIEKKYGGIFALPEFSTDNAAGVAIIASCY